RLGTGRTDLPTGDAEALYESLFEKLLRLDDALLVYPGHNYKGTAVTTIAQEKAENPRLRQHEQAAFVAQMQALRIDLPDHLTEALRTNRTGGRPSRSCSTRPHGGSRSCRWTRCANGSRPPTRSSSFSTSANVTPTRAATSRGRDTSRAASSSC